MPKLIAKHCSSSKYYLRAITATPTGIEPVTVLQRTITVTASSVALENKTVSARILDSGGEGSYGRRGTEF